MSDKDKKDEVDVVGQIDGATEVVFSFDTTGSMRPCIGDVRKKVESTCESMFGNIKGLRIGIIAHGDYCDGDNCIKVLKLTDDWNEISEFIRTAPNTGGGDAPECYELALKEAQDMGWSEGDKDGRALVLIGDATPHPVDYPQNTQRLDWKNELKALGEMGVSVYPLQCLYNEHSSNNEFWNLISELSGTPLMRLNDFGDSAVALEGVAYAAAGSEAFEGYEKRLMAGDHTVSADTHTRNTVLRDEAAKYTAKRGL